MTIYVVTIRHLMATKTALIPKNFIWRRLHSLFGLWIVIFLIEHLLTNSQAALLIGKNGEGFIRAVNLIKHLPYLPVIEIVLLGTPILFHGLLGLKYLMTSQMNSFPGKSSRPLLTNYPRNHGYTWQRITSWILLIGIIAHVAFMRFYMYPTSVNTGEKTYYFTKVTMDPGLYTVADRLSVKLYDKAKVNQAREKIKRLDASLKEITDEAMSLQRESSPLYLYNEQSAETLKAFQQLENQKAWLKGLEKRKLSRGEVIAEAPDFGTATLLVVRDSFKSPFKGILYTIFVLAASYHAFNGLWTFMISWGVVLKVRSQSKALNYSLGIMLIVALLGLASIWGTYFINLKT